MKIAFNPSTVAALIAPPNNKDITFDLRGQNIFARGVKFCGTDTNTWRDIKINNVSIGSNILDLRDGDNTTLTNISGVVTINSTWRPVVDNLTSDSTTSSLSANQGRILKALIDGKSDSGHTHDDRYVKKSGDTMTGILTIDTTNFGTLTIKRNDDANGASIQFRGKSSVYGYIGLNNSTKDKQFLRWNSDTSKTYTILDTSSTYTSNGKGVINGTTITQVDNATNSTNSTNARKLVNWYSARPTSLNTQFGDGSLRIFYATSSTTEGKCPDDATVLHLAWDNNGGYDAQLALAHENNNKIYFRSQNSGTWKPWKTLAFTTDIPSSLKNPYALTISLNGTSQGPYDGSTAKNINITPSSIGAATSDHNHDGRYVYNYGVTQMDGASTGKNALGMTTNSGITEDWWHILQAAWSGDYRWNSQIAFPTQNRNGMYYRSGLDDNTAWGAWVKLLDVNNYSSILDSRYYTESEVNNLLNTKLNRQNLSYGTWNPRDYNLAADYQYNGGDLSISESGGKIHVSVDGYFWQNEGQYRVLDTSDVAGLKNNLTIHQYLSNTDTTWYPLIWGGGPHNNTSDSTGEVYKSYDKLSWQTSSQTLYATNIQTNNIKNLSIGGGIYWNPYVESATDSSDSASITLVRQGVAGGTTLVLSQMNDADDTIQFQTNGSARLYHNSYPILTTQNTYVNNNKGYINGTEITQVNNADTVDGAHLIKNGGGTGIKQVYYLNEFGNNSSYIKLGTLPTVSVTGYSTSKVMFTVKGGIDIAGTNESVYEVAASTRGSIQVTSTLVRGNRELKFGYVSTSSNVEIWMAYDGIYRGITEVEVNSSINFTLAMTETTTKPSGFVEGSYRILAATEDNVASATKLQTSRSIWGQSFDGTADISGSIHIVSTGGYFNEGIRMHIAPNSWCGLIMCGSDNTGTSGTSAKTWSIHNNDGKFYIAQNGSSSFTNGISCENGTWSILSSGNVGIGTTTPAYKLHVAGDIYTTTGFKKNGSSDSYVLLGGGGHKLESSLNVANADTVDGYHASNLWRSDGGIWNPGANISLNASGNNQEWSFGIRRNGYTGCYWHVWDSDLNTLLKVNADNGKVYAPHNFVGNLEGNASTASKLTSSAGNATLPIYFSDGKPVACIASSVFSNLSSSAATNLSVTVAGQNRTIANLYARYIANNFTSRPTSMNVCYGDGTLRYFLATSSTTTSKPENDAHILHFSWDNGGGWDCQLSIPNSLSNHVQWRAMGGKDSNGNYIYNAWKTIANITDIPTVTNYYWANVKISASSSTTTSPIVSNLTATNSIRMGNILLEHTDEINNITNGNIHLNYRNSGNVSLCQGGGKVGIGTTTPSYNLDVMGNTFTTGFGIRPYYLSSSELLSTISPGDGYTYRCLEIGKSAVVSCIIADKVVLSNERGFLIKFNTGYDGQIVLLKGLQNYGYGNGHFWVMPSGCTIIRSDDSNTYISNNQISDAYDDGWSRFFVYSSKYIRWIEFCCN